MTIASICAFAIIAHKELYVPRTVIAFHSVKILIKTCAESLVFEKEE
jgi:hypothetical protein